MSRTNEEASTSDLFDPFGLGKAWRESSLESWSKAMIDFVNSDAYARASAQWLDSYLSVSQSFQQVTDRVMTEALTRYHLPTTADVERLAKRMTHIELRLDDLDARLDEVIRILKALTDAVASTRVAVDKTERVAERAGHAAEEAKRAAAHAAQAAEKTAERISRRGERAAGEAEPAVEPTANGTQPVAAPVTASTKENPAGSAVRPVESREPPAPRRQERK